MSTFLLIRKLYPSVGEHHVVEEETRRLLTVTLPERYVGPAPRSPGPFRYAERNFFSILFLAVYRAVGIPYDRRILYGMINHSVRGLVTATDNLLDDESKNLLPLTLPRGSVRFRSVLQLLLFDRFLFRTLREAAEKGLLAGEDAEGVERRLFHALLPIGEEEAGEEGGVERILPPAEILSSVHMHKGGNLLRLALVAPLFLEKKLSAELALADRGIYRIGMALQVIDDLTDCYADLRDRRHNYLVSFIYHEGAAEERLLLRSLLSGQAPPRGSVADAFPTSVRRVVGKAVGEALAGFELLHQAGFWLKRTSALGVIRRLFKLRGVGHLLTHLPAELRETLSEGLPPEAQ